MGVRSWRTASALWAVLVLVLCASEARAQDECRFASPNGQLEFRLFVSQPRDGMLPRLAYQVLYRGQTAVSTSFLGLHINNVEPMLGDKVGLISFHEIDDTPSYRSFLAEYMQNGSTGRRINVEVGVWDDAVAFRYFIPRTTSIDAILIQDELTEFELAGAVPHSDLGPPLAVPLTSGGWIGIAEVPRAGFPRMSLRLATGGFLTTELARDTAKSVIAFRGRTPLICPWRVLTFAPDREAAIGSYAVRELSAE